ncbi:PE-PPE domain-containing protein, partial [Mycobacteroides immunogenum]
MSGRIYLRLVRGITATFIVATLVFTGLLYGGTTAVTQQLRRISAGVDLTGVTLGLGGTGDGQAHTLPYNFGYAPTPEGLVEAAFTMLQVVGVLPNLGYKPPAHSVVPDGDTFKAVEYPAVVPFLDALFRGAGYSLADSVETGAENMLKALQDVPAGEKVTIVSISQGTMAAERVRAELARRLANGEQNVPNPEFKMIGNPYRPDGGLLTRFAFLSPLSAILGIPFERPGPADSPFKTTDYANQYDGFADFPKYANPLAIVNALAGIVIQHGFPGYFAGDPNDPNRVETTVGNTTYVTFPKTLPLLAPFRIPLSLIGAERFVDFLEPVLRVFVEMGYDRTADPSKTQQLQLFTPLSKVTEALSKLPAAIAQSLDILKTGKYTPTLPKPIVSPETSTTDKQSPAATDSTGTLTAGEKDETTTGLKIDASATPSAKPSTPALSEQTTESKAIGKQVSATTTDDATTGKRTSTESGENAAPSQPTDTHPVT